MKKYLLLLIHLIFSFAVYGQFGVKYTSSNLNLRYEPNTSSRVLVVIPKGTEVKLTEDCDCKWILVRYKDLVGYVSSKYLTEKKVSDTRATYAKSGSKGKKYYINSKGKRVQSPTLYDAAPAGATALCRDGTYSFSRSRRGTCSHHGGVERWLN